MDCSERNRPATSAQFAILSPHSSARSVRQIPTRPAHAFAEIRPPSAIGNLSRGMHRGGGRGRGAVQGLAREHATSRCAVFKVSSAPVLRGRWPVPRVRVPSPGTTPRPRHGCHHVHGRWTGSAGLRLRKHTPDHRSPASRKALFCLSQENAAARPDPGLLAALARHRPGRGTERARDRATVPRRGIRRALMPSQCLVIPALFKV